MYFLEQVKFEIDICY